MSNVRRIQKEYERIRSTHINGIEMKPNELSLFEWDCFIKGPEESPYRNKTFHVLLRIPEDYPFHPPKAKFLTQIFHPNIHFKTGEVCLDILKSNWSPAWSLEVRNTRRWSLECLSSHTGAFIQSGCVKPVELWCRYVIPAKFFFNNIIANVIRTGDKMAYTSLATLLSDSV